MKNLTELETKKLLESAANERVLNKIMKIGTLATDGTNLKKMNEYLLKGMQVTKVGNLSFIIKEEDNVVYIGSNENRITYVLFFRNKAKRRYIKPEIKAYELYNEGGIMAASYNNGHGHHDNGNHNGHNDGKGGHNGNGWGHGGFNDTSFELG